MAGSSATPRASILPSVAAVVLCLLSPAGCRRSAEPAALTDREFWGLVESLSEPPGTFAISPNLVSNEPLFAESVRQLRATGGFVKALQHMNLIVPLVGDFAGSKALRAVGEYLRNRHESMQAFYGSNVGVYLTNEQVRLFCGNLSTLPVAPRAVFIESNGVKSFSHKLTACR